MPTLPQFARRVFFSDVLIEAVPAVLLTAYVCLPAMFYPLTGLPYAGPVLFVAASALCVPVALFLLLALVARLILLDMRDGQYHYWGDFSHRFMFAHYLNRYVRSLIGVFSGTWLYNVCLRVLGARIGTKAIV